MCVCVCRRLAASDCVLLHNIPFPEFRVLNFGGETYTLCQATLLSIQHNEEFAHLLGNETFVVVLKAVVTEVRGLELTCQIQEHHTIDRRPDH
jgi:hypothetical protein